MVERIIVAEATGNYIEDLPVEIVERKGIGHPDSLCDGIAEQISLEYCRWCKKHLGNLLHHNFDKVQLVAGEVNIGNGKGDIIRPIKIQIGGRATPSYNGRKVPIDRIAIEAARYYLKKTMKYLDPVKDVSINCYVGRGAPELASTFENTEANDTSLGVSHWPLSRLERIVLKTSKYVNHTLKRKFPIGEDIKIMGYRNNNKIILTAAIAFIATQIRNAKEYLKFKKEVQNEIKKFNIGHGNQSVEVHLNTADNDDREHFYLTLTGTSAECGDDGSVGRGNRINGLITPFRSISLEAACGKNPISHVGKVYNVLAYQCAQDIAKEVNKVKEAVVYILAQIGQSIDDPLIALAMVRPKNGILSSTTKKEVCDVVKDSLLKVATISERILKEEFRLF